MEIWWNGIPREVWKYGGKGLEEWAWEESVERERVSEKVEGGVDSADCRGI